MKLLSSSVAYRRGTHRIFNPSKTKQIILKKIKQSRLSIYEKILKIDYLHKVQGIHVYAVTHNNKFKVSKQPSWGKGLSDDLAFVSGLMERVERYSASDVNAFNKQIVYANFHQLKAHGAISRWSFVPNNLQRKISTKKKIDGQKSPWIESFSISRNKEVFVPANLVFLKPHWQTNDFSDTTGLASGNNVEEAVLHGLCEIIERHLEDTTHWNRKKIPNIDIESIQNKDSKKIIKKIEEKKIQIFLSYLSDDFEIPAIRVFGYAQGGFFPGSFSFYSATGVHPDKNVALSRALTEFIQSRASAIYSLKERKDEIKIFNFIPKNIYRFYHDIMEENEILKFGEIKSCAMGDILADINFLVESLKRKKVEIIVKNLTHPEIGIPTVRVLARNLQPGVLGIGIVNLNHRVARISHHLKYLNYLKKNIKNVE